MKQVKVAIPSHRWDGEGSFLDFLSAINIKANAIRAWLDSQGVEYHQVSTHEWIVPRRIATMLKLRWS